MSKEAVQGAHTVLHFAANMGGMGTIHDGNEFILYQQNHPMTVNLLQACISAGVKRFLYASSACVYPETLQNDRTVDVSLRESDVWAYPPPLPQGLYGLEKLVDEIFLAQMGSKMDIRIARFHNVFGPGGAWNGGREKAPAAMLRKAIAMGLHPTSGTAFEIWGDGQQRRSFLYIDDAVEAVIKLLESSHRGPLNIGSTTAVSIQSLAEIALSHVGVDPSTIQFSYQPTKPVGVASRNSNNELTLETLGWAPTTSLEEGMRKTGLWIKEQILEELAQKDDPSTLQRMLKSDLLSLTPSKPIVFAILLPITSRGGDNPDNCLENLRKLALSLRRTTWRDTRQGGEVRYSFRIYLAIDDDDAHLLNGDGSSDKPTIVLREEGIYDVVTLHCNHPRGHVCKLWKDCARRAFEDECDYMVLLGDDVELQDEGWMRDAHAEFIRLCSNSGAPFGFGCVAFMDITFPGMPTFPIIHKTHMKIFEGEVIPNVFINQDGDPFLFQLYRRWGCSTMFSSRVSNTIGGGSAARYLKQHAQHWTFEPLSEAISVAEAWLRKENYDLESLLTLDIVVPCYRVDLRILDAIINLKPSSSCSVMFIIIVDNPASPHIFELEARYSHRPDIRIRVNDKNVGASGSRNRGMKESAADWVHFLDDDIIPEQDLLLKAEDVIRAHPRAAGFVGNTFFPLAETVFTTAVHLAGVTYFWDIANKIESDLPWGVTANLLARRNINDSVEFDLIYPKTGGGEDIDFCRKKRSASLARQGEGFFPAPLVKVTHPWWGGGKRSYWRFYNWSVGDGALVKKFPEYTYIDFAPNSAELLLLCGISGALAVFTTQWDMLLASVKAALMVLVVNIVHDCYRHLVQHPQRNINLHSTIKGFYWILAIIESSFIRMFSEMGRTRGMLARREYSCLGRRFDWFTGRVGRGPIAEERMNNLQRAMIFLLLIIFF